MTINPNKAYQNSLSLALPNKFNGNILVAEDSAWMRMTLKWALEEWEAWDSKDGDS